MYQIVNNVGFAIIKTIWKLYVRFKHPWNDSMSIFRIFGEVLDIIIIIL
jgi:hypothetical protein